MTSFHNDQHAVMLRVCLSCYNIDVVVNEGGKLAFESFELILSAPIAQWLSIRLII